jgi:predicted DNA-binding transcriptional regulator YafY
VSNMHRILWFDERVRAMRNPNARDLAEQFEISVRQAGRDIEYMQSSLFRHLILSRLIVVFPRYFFKVTLLLEGSC